MNINSESDKSELTLIGYFKILLQYRVLISSVTIICTGIGLAIALLSTPIYRAEVLLAPVSKDGSNYGINALASQFGGLASLAGINIRGRNDSSTVAIATLMSREFTDKFFVQENLMPVLFEKAWDANAGTWKKDIVAPTLWDAYNLFDKSIRSIDIDKKTGLVTLSIDWKDPKLAAAWANKLVVMLNSSLRADAIDESKQNLKFLREQIEKTSIVQIQQSLFGLVEAEMKKAMLANVTSEYAFKVIDPAVIPERKIKPKRASIVIMSFMLGGFLGTFIALIRRYMREQ